jgi:hypothetical protein
MEETRKPAPMEAVGSIIVADQEAKKAILVQDVEPFDLDFSCKEFSYCPLAPCLVSSTAGQR